MTKYIFLILLPLLIIGCVTVPVAYFNPENFKSMHNVALLVKESKVTATGNAWLWYADVEKFDLPVVWYINKMWSYNRGISMESETSKSGLSWKSEVGAIDSQLTVDRKMSKTLRDYLVNYDIKSVIRGEFLKGWMQLGSFSIISGKKVEEIYTRCITNSGPEKGWLSFLEGLKNDLSVDTLILININLWGLKRGMMSNKGNFFISTNLRIIRVSDQIDLWDDSAEIDFVEGNFKKDSKSLEKFFQEDKPVFYQNLQELVQEAVREIIEPLNKSTHPFNANK